jgi:sugar-specific transcriptional regulator TrmB
METTKTTSYLASLSQAGLTYTQAKIYELLLKNGPLKAGKIHQKTDLKRGLVYKVLEELVDLGMVNKKEPGKVAIFEAEHPAKLKDLAEKQEQKAKTAQLVLDGLLGQMISEFNLVSGRPGVQFFEGKEGIKRVLEDSLTSRTEIYSYADIDAINKYINDLNMDYVAKREKLKLKKKGIFLDTPETRRLLAGYHTDITESRVIKHSGTPFATVMQIYDNKISYITLTRERMIGVIVEDPLIYHMHLYLFEYMWSTAERI